MRINAVVLFSVLALTCFAGNSLLCRVALARTQIDAATFTTTRLVAGALILAILSRARASTAPGHGNWLSAAALFAYAAGFSFAYLKLSAGTGALLLFGAVQVTMIGCGLRKGERLNARQLAGFLLAVAGLVGLLLPGISAPSLQGSALMLGAGVAWGVYSLRGRGAGNPTRVTAGNFIRSVPFAVGLSLVCIGSARFDLAGFWLAVASGAITSGLGYVIWYRVLPHLKATNAATLQLSVPVLAALGGSVFLTEALTARLICASAAVLGGIALVIRGPVYRQDRPHTALRE